LSKRLCKICKIKPPYLNFQWLIGPSSIYVAKQQSQRTKWNHKQNICLTFQWLCLILYLYKQFLRLGQNIPLSYSLLWEHVVRWKWARTWISALLSARALRKILYLSSWQFHLAVSSDSIVKGIIDDIIKTAVKAAKVDEQKNKYLQYLQQSCQIKQRYTFHLHPALIE
jgi:hypothetical protein